MNGSTFDVTKFESVHQLGGIRTGTLDHPQPMGGQACRAAFFHTGSPLAFTVLLDRGGDIADATYAGLSLAYLTPNGCAPPGHAYHRGIDWLNNWAGGLVTTCGPRHIGGPDPDQPDTSLHGRHHNTPAAVTAVVQPDPRRKQFKMALELTIRDTRMFGPVVETRRRISATLGEPVIRIHDEVTNLGNQPCPHHWLYHCNFGYPLLDEGATVDYRGDVDHTWNTSEGPLAIDVTKRPGRVPGPRADHAGGGECGAVLRMKADRAGLCRATLANAKRGLSVELRWPAKQMPRMAHWQHFGAGGYVMGLEPFKGALMRNDPSAEGRSALKPGQTRKYDLTIAVKGTAH